MFRTFVFYGMGGYLTSFGMRDLATRLTKISTVSVHNWYDDVSPEVNKTADKVALFGYSLGANQLGWLGSRFKREVELGVAFDPSRQSPLCGQGKDGIWFQEAKNYKKLLCFFNKNTMIFGGSTYRGSNVEEHMINMPHLAVHLSDLLKNKAMDYAVAVKDD